MPIHHEDPHGDPNHEEHEDQHEDPVCEWERVAASGVYGAGDEPVHVEEDWDEDEKGKGSVDDVFGVTLE